MKRTTRLDRFSITNDSSRVLAVRLEPWAEELELAPDSKFEVEAVGPEDGFLELVWGDDEVTIYGWTGSTVSVLCEGKVVSRSGWLPVPPLPGSTETEVDAYRKLFEAKKAEYRERQSGKQGQEPGGQKR